MAMFHWYSDALKEYGRGQIVAIGDTVEEARENARSSYLTYIGGPNGFVDEEEYDERVALFEADIAAEPTADNAIFIPGSE